MSNSKINYISEKFEDIMIALGLDMNDHSLIDTPRRVAKMFVDELFVGLDDSQFPKITVQQNNFGYDQMLVEGNIMINSICEHHFVPIIGYCHIAYIPKDKVIGLSKLNRVAQFYAKRPQVQERLTQVIFNKLKEVLETDDVAVTIDAVHMCVRMRGIRDYNASTRSTALGGKFLDGARAEYFNAIPRLTDLKL